MINKLRQQPYPHQSSFDISNDVATTFRDPSSYIHSMVMTCGATLLKPMLAQADSQATTRAGRHQELQTMKVVVTLCNRDQGGWPPTPSNPKSGRSNSFAPSSCFVVLVLGGIIMQQNKLVVAVRSEDPRLPVPSWPSPSSGGPHLRLCA